MFVLAGPIVFEWIIECGNVGITESNCPYTALSECWLGSLHRESMVMR